MIPLMTMLWTLASLMTPDSAAVTNHALRLIVETSDDLSRYSVEAEFRFHLGPAAHEVLFFFPDVETPGELRAVELDGRAVDPAWIVIGTHPRFGGKVFVLRCGECGLAPGEHVLRVVGPAVPTPERGLTRWGGWHPFLSGRDVPVPIELEVRTPSRYAVIASGRQVEDHVETGRRTSRWMTQHPQGWVFLAVGLYRTLVTTETAPALDVVWPVGNEAIDAVMASAEPRGMLAFFQGVFGRLHRGTQFRLVIFPEAAVENFSHDGLIGMSTASYERARQGGDYFQAALAHELSHYWWGDLVQPQGPGRRWVTEGFAEYSRYLYEVHAGVEPLSWAYRNLLVLSRFGNGPLPPPLGGEPEDADEVYYQKGPFVLRMLADEIGPDRLLNAMRDFVARARESAVSVSDFRGAVEQEAGRDLSWFFEQWLERRTGPMLALEDLAWDQDSAGYRVYGTLVQDAPAYRLTVPLEVRLAGGGRVRHTVPVHGARTPFVVPVGRHPEHVTVDPERQLFLWHAPDRLPVTFVDAWRRLEGNDGQIVMGTDVPESTRARLIAFLRGRFPRLQSGPVTDIRGDVVVVGEAATRLRQARAPHLDAPPPGTVQAFALRSPDDPESVIVGIEGTWPETWPEMLPQAPLNFVRYRDGAMILAQPPALPVIRSEIPSRASPRTR